MNKFTIKTILLTIIFLTSASFATAQSLKDNPDYRTSVKLKRQSEVAFDEGDYEESKKLANEAVLYAEKSDAWIIMMKNKYKANSALVRVKRRLDTAKRLNAKVNFPDALEKGKTLYDTANQLYVEESFLESYPISMQALDAMKDIKYVASKGNLPAAYVVMDNPGNEDCLWNIAGYENIYDNPLEWKKIYEANKSILPQPGNPNLITPGLVLTIPSLNGEVRSGTLINGVIK